MAGHDQRCASVPAHEPLGAVAVVSLDVDRGVYAESTCALPGEHVGGVRGAARVRRSRSGSERIRVPGSRTAGTPGSRAPPRRESPSLWGRRPPPWPERSRGGAARTGRAGWWLDVAAGRRIATHPLEEGAVDGGESEVSGAAVGPCAGAMMGVWPPLELASSAGQDHGSTGRRPGDGVTKGRRRATASSPRCWSGTSAARER